MRRVLRIFPAYYAYLLVVFTIAVTGIAVVSHGDLAVAALYLRDYTSADRWTDHTWSLAVEEQFYLIWPLLLLALSKKRLIVFGFVVLVFEPLIRVVTYVLAPSMRDGITVMFHTRADMLVFGCLLALTRFDPTVLRFKERYATKSVAMTAIAVLVVVCPVAYARFHDGFLMSIGYTVQGACIAILLLWLVDNPRERLGQVLNWGPIAAIGTLSYSIYLWHVVFLFPIHGVSFPFPINVVLTFVVAWCSFRFVEMPFNGLRRRFGSVAVASEPLPIPGPLERQPSPETRSGAPSTTTSRSDEHDARVSES